MRRTIWIAFFLSICLSSFCNASWGTPGVGQYHIQTDEGPERYFRFQTDSGQYRKEKRLQDGTVIGTDAWIDAAGYLRQKDYIADKKGYRILKSKTVYVGQGRRIEDAMSSVKGVPAQAGVLVDPERSHIPRKIARIRTTTHRPIYIYPSTTPSRPSSTSTTVPITQGYISPTEAALIPPSPYLGYDHYPQPEVFIRPHSQPVDHNFSAGIKDSPNNIRKSAVPLPNNELVPPTQRPRRIRPIAVYSTTPSPISISEASDYPSSTPKYEYSSPTPFSSSSTSPAPESSSRFSPIATNDYDDLYNYNRYSSTTEKPTTGYDYPYSSTGYLSSTERPYTDTSTSYDDLLPQTRRRRPYYRNRNDPLIYNNNLGSGYEDQFPEYDGVAVTRNGFRYYLPRQYQEEENIGHDKRAGSFGYVDPFGIRRVIYYNASPENGFIHRKNNRYVGLDATPYDPRPL